MTTPTQTPAAELVKRVLKRLSNREHKFSKAMWRTDDRATKDSLNARWRDYYAAAQLVRGAQRDARRAAKRVASGAPPAVHCQICARPILANTGLIAHHGYQRPEGWHHQTASCPGARYRPYEVACDALPPAIQSTERYIASTAQALAHLIASPPARYEWQPKDSWGNPRGERKVAERPEGFDPATCCPDYRGDSYNTRYLAARSGLERNLKLATDNLAYLRERLAAWRPAAAQQLAPEEQA